LDTIAWQVNSFYAALQLFDYCRANLDQREPGEREDEQQRKSRHLFLSWLPIAGRDAAMAIYHFGIAAEGVRRTLGMCPILRTSVLHPELRQAIRGFSVDFPAYEKIRHAVAHAAEKDKTPNLSAEHRVVTNGGQVQGITITGGQGVFKDLSGGRAGGYAITDHFQGRLFTNTWEGEVLTYELSQASLDKLNTSAKAIFAAFPQASQS
jgi:hypothetical protein